ncbi:MAG: FtsX-like permease family protein [Promethearchaeota archaeon]
MIGQAFKRIIRSWPLFIAVIAGVLISSTMFATVNIGSNEIVNDMVDEAIAGVSTDMTISFGYGGLSTSSIENLVTNVANVANVQHAEIQSRYENITWGMYEPLPSFYEAFIGLESDSKAYEGITIDSGATTLGANQTFMLTSSTSAGEYELHDKINITLEGSYGVNCTLSLDIVGFVSATDEALGILVEENYFWQYASERNLFILDWTTTVKPVLDYFYDNLGWWPGFDVYIAVYIDRVAIISAVDIQGTLTRLTTVEQQISNQVYMYGAYVYDHLASALYMLSYLSQALLLIFLFVAAPIFFIAIYMGITLSDVSFNLRRRETGLLLSKGFTRGTILRLYMTEGMIIGFLTGFGGILIALVIVPFFIRAGPWTPVSIASLGLDTIFWCVAFSCLVAGISIYFAARRATKISTVEALREYSQAAQSTGYRKMLAWTALILGGYKIFVWLLGINVQEIVFTIPYPGFLAMILLYSWYSIDSALGPFAIILFIYGFSKVAVQGSKIVYRISEKIISRSMGDIGALATRSIQRNPTRTAAVVFMLALVLGYGISTVAVLASEQDYIIRSVYTDVGADISAAVSPSRNATALISKAESITGVESATVELLTTFGMGYYSSISVRGIIAENWSQTAYYEETWFSFISADQALADLSNDNRTIIIQRGVAKNYDLALGDYITVTIGAEQVPLRIVGFFGPEIQSFYSARGYHSYVSYELLEEFNQINGSTAHLLVNISPSANATAVCEALEEFSEISSATSAIEQIEEYTVSPITNAQSNMMQMGLIFSFLLASIGTLIVITFTLKEKQRENALMAARGLSFRQTASVLIAESTSWVIFAVLIGIFTGVIAASGNLQNYTLMDPLLIRSPLILLSTQVLLQIFAMVSSLILCAIVPMLIAARHAQTAIDILR